MSLDTSFNRKTVLLCGSLLTLFGCASSPHDPKEKFYLIASNIKVPYWQTAANGFIREATLMGVKAEMVGPDTYDPKAEEAEISRVAKLKPSGILISVADAAMLTPAINSAVSSGVPVITIDSDDPNSKRLMFIGTNNYDAGLMGGKTLVKQMNGKGNLVVLTMPGQANLNERLHGYKDAIADHPGLKIVQTVDIKGDPRIAFDTTTDLIKKNAKIDGFICLEALAGKEVAEVFDRNNVSGKTIMAFDTDEGTLNWIQKGKIAATIAQKPYTMAFFGLQMLDTFVHRKLKTLDGNYAQDPFSPIPTFIDTGATLIDKGNVDVFLKARESVKSES
ncbi:MAG: substrate-binding domain-containing protein [Acidobacteriota bacterium]|nr:substrate-binding domain-containing protein [Acidobacteriota bacterium]